jgi:hypothetical protein
MLEERATVVRKTFLILLSLVWTTLSFTTQAKAESLQLTLTSNSYLMNNGRATLTGFFTNMGNVNFVANRRDLNFTPGLFPLEVDAVQSDGVTNYTMAVPGMSTTAPLPLLDLVALAPLAPGAYNGTLTFSGVAGSDLNATTAPFHFTLTVPANVPESAAVLMLGVGLMLVAALIRKRRSGRRGSKLDSRPRLNKGLERR